VLQNESVDDGHEHFEDIIESHDDSSIASAVLDKHNDKLADHEKYNIDADDGSDSGKQVKLIERDANAENNASSAEVSRLHVLYDPRHREPSYWYCLFNLFTVHGSCSNTSYLLY
jgi:ribosome biogenesis protein MAK21